MLCALLNIFCLNLKFWFSENFKRWQWIIEVKKISITSCPLALLSLILTYRDLDLELLELLTGFGEPREDEEERDDAEISEITVDAFIPLTPRKYEYDPPADFINLLPAVNGTNKILKKKTKFLKHLNLLLRVLHSKK